VLDELADFMAQLFGHALLSTGGHVLIY